MPTHTQEKVEQLLATTAALGGVVLLIVEHEKNRKAAIEKAREKLFNSNYKECSDYLEVMDVLSEGKDKLFYVEKGDKLDSLIFKIIEDFDSGRIALMDKKNHSGLKVIKSNPSKTSFIVIISRKQVEKSYPRLFEYVMFKQSI